MTGQQGVLLDTELRWDCAGKVGIGACPARPVALLDKNRRFGVMATLLDLGLEPLRPALPLLPLVRHWAPVGPS